ncbi:MAG TPA: fluoride efflux transporter CrcB [Solirubrobacteraceae bacterium]
MTFWVWSGVAVLGGLSAIARFALDGVVASRAGRSFPYGTLAVNASASFLLGLVTGLALTGNALLLVGTATIGSYSTFSTWMLETHRLAEDGEMGAAVANIVVSLAVGVGAAALGRAIVGR